MEPLAKLTILAKGAKYGVSCSYSGSRRQKGTVEKVSLEGICHSWSANGRCISLLKAFYSNDCIFDCAYRVNRRISDIPRASFTPREMALFSYYALGWMMGGKIETLLADERVWRVMESRRKVLRERHRFLGILRFSDLEGVLYAPFEPEADLLPLVAGHFARRLGGERWVIHDLGRRRDAAGPKVKGAATFYYGASLCPG